MSDAAFNRLMELIHQGYGVDVFADEDGRYVEIKITKHKRKGVIVVTYDELDWTEFDIGLYKINRLVEKFERS